jgi:hypothetical protein
LRSGLPQNGFETGSSPFCDSFNQVGCDLRWTDVHGSAVKEILE